MALLVSVIFMSVVLALGLALASLGYKEVVLASAATQSQYAFYAADSGLECALYADQQLDAFNYSTPAGTMSCDGQTFALTSPDPAGASTRVTTASLSLDGGSRCAQISVYKPQDANGTTYIYSTGYNVACGDDTNTSLVARGLETHYGGP